MFSTKDQVKVLRHQKHDTQKENIHKHNYNFYSVKHAVMMMKHKL